MLCFPRTRLSNLHTLKFDGAETGVLLSQFAQHLRRKNADVLDIYLISLDDAGMSQALVYLETRR